MYSSLQNQLYNLIHFFFGFFVVFVIYPKLIFSKDGQSKLENLVANFIKMVFLVIIMGYVLVITKLYEFIGIAIVLTIIFYVKNFIINKKFSLGEVLTSINVYFFDFIDKKRSPVKDVLGYINKKKNHLKEFISENFDSKAKNINYLLLIVVIIYSAYLRFYDAVTSPVPGLSDGVVTLSWMKYISRRELFHEEIYPQGFHICSATIQKFAYINSLYILKYMGPFNEVLIVLGIFFFIYKLTDRPGLGVIGATIYGLLFSLLPIEWVRQAATNSQEFGFVFVVPTIYFAYKYIKNKHKNDLITAFSGVAVLMLVHAVALCFTAIGVIALCLAAVILNIKEHFKSVFLMGISSIIAVIIGLIPIGYGLLIGKKFHDSSEEFLLATIATDYPKLTNFEIVAIVAMVLMVLYFIIRIKNFSKNLFELFIFFFTAMSFFTYYAAGVWTKNSVIITRFPELWGLVLPISISFGIYILSKVLIKNRIKNVLDIGLTCGLLIFTIVSLKPQPIITYKMEWDSRVEQYLRINKMLRPTEWMIVSAEEDYAVVLGAGNHWEPQYLVQLCDPSEEKLKRNDTNEVLSTPDIFIYYEKNIFKTNFNNWIPKYEAREQLKPALMQWIKTYGENHDNLSKFYEDENLIIYHIHQEQTRQELFNNIWAN